MQLGRWLAVAAGIVALTSAAIVRGDPAPAGPPATQAAAEPEVSEPAESPEQPRPHMAPMGQASDVGKSPLLWQRATDGWLGLRPALEDAGISIGARVVADYSNVLSGGQSTGGSAFRDLFNVNLTLDTDHLLGLKGGTFFVNFQNQTGDDGSRDVGDLQRFDNIDADGRTEIAEVWYEQALFGDTLRIRVGKIDPNAIFAATANGSEFLNSSMGISPTIIMPHYPDGSTGVQGIYTPADWFYIGGGVFDGSFASGIHTGEYGPAHLFKPPHDLSLFAETGLKWGPGGQTGRVAIGGWRNTADFVRFDGTIQEGTSGVYAMAEHTFWRPNPADDKDKRGIAGFFQYGYADPRVMLFTEHLGGGLAWTGPIATRADDILGLGMTWVRFADGADLAHNEEWDVELFYKIQITTYLSFKPDLQYIHNPGGGGAGRDDAVVGTVRMVVDF